MPLSDNLLIHCVSSHSCTMTSIRRSSAWTAGLVSLSASVFLWRVCLVWFGLGFCLFCFVGVFDWLFLKTKKRKQVSLCHVISFIVKDKCMLGFNLSLSYLKVSFRKVVRQGVENACEEEYLNINLSLIFWFIQKTEKMIFCFLSCESLILLQKWIFTLAIAVDIPAWKSFALGFTHLNCNRGKQRGRIQAGGSS